MLGRLEGMKDVIEHVNKQFKDPVRSHSWEMYSNFINLLALDLYFSSLEFIAVWILKNASGDDPIQVPRLCSTQRA